VYSDLTSFFRASLMCVLYLVLKLQPIWPIYFLLHTKNLTILAYISQNFIAVQYVCYYYVSGKWFSIHIT
jgi:hypothetical protein